MEGKRLSSKLIDGTFPDYRRVIPQDRTVSAEIDGPTLKAAVDRVFNRIQRTRQGDAISFRDTKLTLTVNNLPLALLKSRSTSTASAKSR